MAPTYLTRLPQILLQQCCTSIVAFPRVLRSPQPTVFWNAPSHLGWALAFKSQLRCFLLRILYSRLTSFWPGLLSHRSHFRHTATAGRPWHITTTYTSLSPQAARFEEWLYFCLTIPVSRTLCICNRCVIDAVFKGWVVHTWTETWKVTCVPM